MPSVGEMLRRERESHDATLEQISQATKIDPSYFEALERDDLAALPGWAYGKFYIRAYAEVLGFDPERLIAEYESRRAGQEPRQEPAAGQPEPRNAWQEALRKSREEARKKREVSRAAQEPTPAVEIPEPPAPAPTAAARPKRTRAALALAAAGLLIVVAVFYGSSPRVTGPSPDVQEEVEEIVASPEPAPPRELPEEPAPVPPAPMPEPSHLSVPEFGVGRAVVERVLSGPSDRFADGSVAWFQTLVLGGKRGEAIRHVWLREGKAVHSTALKLGGARWRTHSSKTLHGTGSWTVEARDAAGRVLARAKFACLAP